MANVEPFLAKKKQQEEFAQQQWRQSFASIDVSLNLRPYLQKLDEFLPTEFNESVWNCEGVSFDLTAERNPIQFYGNGTRLQCTTELTYQLKLSYCPKCTYLIDKKGTCLTPRIGGSCGIGEVPRKAAIGFTSDLSILPNYRIKSTTQLTKLDLIDPCEITFASIDITSELKEKITEEMETVTMEIDKKIGAIPIRNELDIAWTTLSSPIEIKPYGHLLLNPKTVSVGHLSFNQSKLNFPIELKASPDFTTIVTENKFGSLPDLSTYSNKKGFDFTVQLNLGYDSVSSFLTTALSSQKITIRNKEIFLDSIRTTPTSNSKITIDIFFSGELNGTLKLVGTPCLQDSTELLFFPDLVHHISFTKRMYSFLSKLFKKTIAKELNAALTIPISPLLDDLKKEIEQALNTELSNDVKLSGSVENIQLLHIDAKEPFFNTFIRMNGTMKLSQ